MEKLSRSGSSLYGEIADELYADIRAGKYLAAHSFPSLTKIMRRFNVTRVTAMRSVDELKRRGVVSATPRSGLMVNKANRTIGLILPGVAYSEFFPPIMSGISRRCQEMGYSLLFGDVYSKNPQIRMRQAKALAQDFAEKHVAGVVFQPIEFMGSVKRINKEIVTILGAAGIPVVLVDYDIVPVPGRSDFDLVGINNFDAGRRLALHLIAAGAKNIHFMHNHWAASIQNRFAGVNSAISDGLVNHKTMNVFKGDPTDMTAVRDYFNTHKPDAIICGNDTTAIHLKHVFDRLGVRVPEDIMLAGFDDVQFSKVMSPQLTTIHQPCDGIAAMAFKAMLERMADPSLPPREILLPAPLVVRGSTRCEEGSLGKARKNSRRMDGDGAQGRMPIMSRSMKHDVSKQKGSME